MTKAIRIALVNDYMIVLEGLRALVTGTSPAMQVVEMDVRAKPKKRVDVTLLDTYGEVIAPEERVRSLSSDPSNGAVVVFSFSDSSTAVDRWLRSGATGFISKAVSREQIVAGIAAAARGERVVLTQRTRYGQVDEVLRWPGRDAGLTQRESELLALLPTGMTNRELADHLFVSENTVKTHLRGLYSKLDVRNRAQAVALAEQGILGDRYSS